MKIRELFVKLGVEADSDEVKNFEGALDRAKSSMKDLLSWAGKTTAVFAGMFGGMAALSKVHGEFAEEAVRTSDAFGMATDSYQELRFAFQSLNASSDDLHDVLQSVQRAVYRAGQGATTYTRALAELNLTHEQLQGLNPAQTFDQIVRAAREAQAAGEDVTGVMGDFFGSDLSRRILPGILSAEGSFEKFRRMAQESGLVIEEDLLEKAAKAQLQFRMFGATMTGLSRIVGIRLAPAFGRLATHIFDAATVFQRYFDGTFEKLSNFLSSEFEKIKRYFVSIHHVVQTYVGGWRTLFGVLLAGIVAVNAGMGGMAFLSAWGAVKALLAAVAKVVTGSIAVALFKVIAIAMLVAAAFIAIALVVEDIVAYFNGVDSVLGRLVKSLITAKEATLNGLGKAVVWVMDIFRSLFRTMMSSFGFLFDELKAFAGTFISLLKRIAPIIGGVIVVALGLVMAAIIVIVVLFVGVLKVLGGIIKFILWLNDLARSFALIVWEGILAGIKQISDNWAMFKAALRGTFDNVSAAVDRIVNKVKEMVERLKGIPGVGFLSTAGRGIGRGLSRARDSLGRTTIRNPYRGGSNQTNQSVDASNMRVEVNVENASDAPDAVGKAVGNSLQDTFGSFLGSQYAIGG